MIFLKFVILFYSFFLPNVINNIQFFLKQTNTWGLFYIPCHLVLPPLSSDGNKFPTPKEEEIFLTMTRRKKAIEGLGKIMQGMKVKERSKNNNSVKKNGPSPLKDNLWRTNFRLG